MGSGERTAGAGDGESMKERVYSLRGRSSAADTASTPAVKIRAASTAGHAPLRTTSSLTAAALSAASACRASVTHVS